MTDARNLPPFVNEKHRRRANHQGAKQIVVDSDDGDSDWESFKIALVLALQKRLSCERTNKALELRREQEVSRLLPFDGVNAPASFASPIEGETGPEVGLDP